MLQHLQHNRCAICETDLNAVVACLDHDHQSGQIRDVLCANCNGLEGKIFNLSRRGKRAGTVSTYLLSILSYWDKHRKHPSMMLHPAHCTPDEKKALKAKKAKEKRQKLSLKNKSQKSSKSKTNP